MLLRVCACARANCTSGVCVWVCVCGRIFHSVRVHEEIVPQQLLNLLGSRRRRRRQQRQGAWPAALINAIVKTRWCAPCSHNSMKGKEQKNNNNHAFLWFLSLLFSSVGWFHCMQLKAYHAEPGWNMWSQYVSEINYFWMLALLMISCTHLKKGKVSQQFFIVMHRYHFFTKRPEDKFFGTLAFW